MPYPKKKIHLPVIWSPEEVTRLIDAAPIPFYRTILMTLYGTGVRRAECAALKLTDIDSARMVVHVQGGKGDKDRDIVLSPHLRDEIKPTIAGWSANPPCGYSPGAAGTAPITPLATRSSGTPVVSPPAAPESTSLSTRASGGNLESPSGGAGGRRGRVSLARLGA